MKINSLTYFRGVAILLIVAGHSYGHWVINSFSEKVLANLITGGTALFVFISGFLFHHIYYIEFDQKAFILKKIKNVLIPYIVLSTGALTVRIILNKPIFFMGTLYEHIMDAGYRMLIGNITTGYWYIPFISIVFIVSPLFIRYIKFSFKMRIFLFFFCLLVSMLMQRPADNVSPIHSFLYFVSIYLLGINCSIDQQKIFNFIHDKTIVLGVFVLAFAMLEAATRNDFGNYSKTEMFSFNGIDIIIVQKIFMCFFFLSFFHKYENKNISILKFVAGLSFPIYFLHPWVLKLVAKMQLVSYVKFLPDFSVFIMTTLVVTVSSIFVAYIIKLILRNNSKFVIGW